MADLPSGFTPVVPEGFAPIESPAPSKSVTPKVAPMGDIPVLGQAIRDVNERGSFGWATPLITTLAPETYPELAAVLGLTLLGGPLAGAAGKPALALAGKGGQALAKAGARVLSAAVPAAVAGAATGQGATKSGVTAGAGQAALEAAIPAVRSMPFLSQWLSKRAAKIDADKLVKEIGTLVPEWAPLMKGKKSAQAMFDTLVGPEGERAMYAGYDAAKRAAFSGQGPVQSPALAAYFTLKAAEPTASARIKQGAKALRGKAGPVAIQRDVAAELFDELEKDAIMAAGRVKNDPRAGDILKLAERARSELATSLNAPDLLSAYAQTRTGRALMDFFNDAKAIIPGPKYDAPAAMKAATTKEGMKPLADANLDSVTALVNRGRPGYAERGGSLRVPIGKGVSVPLGVSGAHAAYDPGTLARLGEGLAVQPTARAISDAVMEP